MPSVYIHGLRGDEDAVRKFRGTLCRIIADVKELDLQTRDVNVYVLTEYAPPECPNVTVEIRGLSGETTLDDQNTLAKTVHDAIRALLRQLHRPEHDPLVDRVEVYVLTFDPEEQGYASSRMSKPARTLKLVE